MRHITDVFCQFLLVTNGTGAALARHWLIALGFIYYSGNSDAGTLVAYIGGQHARIQLTTMKGNTMNQDTNNIGTLAPVLQSAAVVPMDSIKGKAVSAGNRWCKLIKKGENSKLRESVAVEIPAVMAIPADALQVPAIHDYLLEAYEQLRNETVKARVIAGDSIIAYSALSLDSLAATATALNEVSGIGQLSEERIKSWFDADARELVLIALADKLGVSDTATPEDMKRLEQSANQMRDNLAKLSSRKPVHFDDRVKKALNFALDAADTGDSITSRLRDKLNIAVSGDDMLLNLGL